VFNLFGGNNLLLYGIFFIIHLIIQLISGGLTPSA